MTMSILGHYNNFFFAAHLLDIAMGFKTLRTILSSVTHNGKQVYNYILSNTVVNIKSTASKLKLLLETIRGFIISSAD